MKDTKSDIFSYISNPEVDAICINTNGHFTRSGLALMNEGAAKELADKWPEISKRLGKLLLQFKSNIPYVIGAFDDNSQLFNLSKQSLDDKKYKCLVFNFPIINNLKNGINIDLIKQSAAIMTDYSNQYNLKKVILENPNNLLKQHLDDHLDTRFYFWDSFEG